MTDDHGGRRPNHLRGQTSPYLLQHLYNPVDWNHWGEEAHSRARREGKPVFLSIGYAACHWCHVMERESFEDSRIAEFLNRHFVSIKVDREERPDVDEIYMNAVQLLTGAGGWPLNVFLTPDLRPFFGGTYFPPGDSYGRPGFLGLLQQLHAAWSSRREEVEQSAEQLTEHLRHLALGAPAEASAQPVGRAERARAAAELAQRFDSRWGGFGSAPKFPPDGALALLLRSYVRDGEAVTLELVERTLDGMALGGLYDHIGGGFARYSVDEQWLVPHFEKMLYNQALLVPVYADAWRLTGKPLYRRVVEQTLDFVQRELTDRHGGFYASLDADSEGEEGRFYVWTPSEIDAVLGAEEGSLFREVYGVTSAGNFEGRSIPALLGGSLAVQAERLDTTEARLVERLTPLRRRLLEARQERTRPGTDDKVLTAWNGLMLTALARAYQAFGRPQDLLAARAAADFLLDRMRQGDRLRVTFREDRARLNAYLDEYAFLSRGLLDLYESCFEPGYLGAAEQLARTLVARFADLERGGFFFTSDDHEQLLTRNRSLHDGALPSGTGVATELLLRLAIHLDDDAFRESAHRALDALQPAVARMPSGYSTLVSAADWAEGPVQEVAIVGKREDPATQALLAVVRRGYRPRLAVALAPPGGAPGQSALLRGKTVSAGLPTAYVCRNYACQQPTTDPTELEQLLD